MKELLDQKLANEFQNTYSKGGDIFMEGKGDMPPQPQPTSPEHSEGIYGQRVKDIKTLEKNNNLPVGIRKALEDIKRQEVIKNAALGDSERVDIAAELLKRDLTEKERTAILEAHGQGRGEKGKDSDEAGVYNYTKAQLLRKARILDEAGFSKEDRRILMDAGLVGIARTGVPSIDAELDVMDNVIDTKLKNPLSVYLEAITNVSRFTGVDDAKKQSAINEIKNAIREEYKISEKNRPAEEQERRYSLYFTPAEQENLRRDPTEWLDTQFDILYRFAEEGQELSSPIINGVQQQVSQAVDFVKNYRPEIMSDFLTQFTVRLHLLQERTAMGYRSIDNIKQASHELRLHGLLTGMTLEKGRVSAMFNRFQDLLESARLSGNKRHHVMLEDAYKLQRILIDEQMNFAKKGIGNFGDLSDMKAGRVEDQESRDPDNWDDFTWAERMTGKQIDEADENKLPKERKNKILRIKRINADITRSVRTAYDVFVSSQRMGVIVARGKYLFSDLAYRSDPIGPLNVYNMEEMLFEKFDMYNPQQEKLVDKMKMDMAESYLKDQSSKEVLSEEQKLNLGKRLFRDIFAVPDFFSSGWRIDGVTKALEQRFGKERSKDFALFMRLRKAEPEEREEIWKKIQEFRPEEIIRLFRERKNDALDNLYEKMQAIDPSLKLTDKEELANRPDDEGGEGRETTVYDKFKQRYGAVIGFLRQEGFNSRDEIGNQTPTQINLSKLSEKQTDIVNKFLGSSSGAQKLKELAEAMQEYIEDKQNNLVMDLLKDTSFADVYARSIIIDDALLDKLEDERSETDNHRGYVPLSKTIGEAGAGGDTLVRSWSDTENAIKAGNALLKFIKEENIEKKTGDALEFASSAMSYNGLGQKGQAECVRYTIGTYLNLVKLDKAWDIIGINSLPFRIPASEAQRIFGVQAGTVGRDELRGMLDHLNGSLNASITKAKEKLKEDIKALEVSVKYKTPEERAARAKELTDKLEKDEKESHKFYKDMEGMLELTGKDFLRRTGLRLILFLILSAIGEGYKAGEAAFKDISK